MRWKKASRSMTNQECTEVSHDLPEHVAVRDSKNPTGPVLIFDEESWRAFIRDVQRT